MEGDTWQLDLEVILGNFPIKSFFKKEVFTKIPIKWIPFSSQYPHFTLYYTRVLLFKEFTRMPAVAILRIFSLFLRLLLFAAEIQPLSCNWVGRAAVEREKLDGGVFVIIAWREGRSARMISLDLRCASSSFATYLVLSLFLVSSSSFLKCY